MVKNRHELSAATAGPIAIVGVGCHLPGNITSVEDLAIALREGRDCITEVPPERWDADGFYDFDALSPGKTYVRHGGFVHDIDRFDAAFFGITDAEACRMDPQQRMALQTTWHALENAGQSAEELLGSKTGVFVAMMNTNGYSQLKALIEGDEGITGYDAIGDAMSIAAGRISHFLGLQGPSLAVDTASSGSMIAVHLACRSIQSEECDSAIVVGVNAMLHPAVHIAFSRLGLMSRRGRCAAFDETADGYIRGEGCLAVLLRRQSLALARRDHIVANIVGTAVNQDGRTPSIAAPNGASQEKVICRALSRARVTPNDIGYVEAHGTGTPVGDRTEMGALTNVYGPERPGSTPLFVGSVKGNFGHLEAGAGLLGLVKAALSLERELIFPTLHFKRLHPGIDLGRAPVCVAATGIPWPRSQRRRLAGVNSFGYSGTNTHAVLEEALPAEDGGSLSTKRSCELVVLSARTAVGLQELVDRWMHFLAQDSDTPLRDIAFTAATGRAHLRHRLAVVGRDRKEICEKLRSWRDGQMPDGLAAGQANTRRNPKLAFVFPGHGSGYARMGRQLYKTESRFRAAVDRVAALMNAGSGVRLNEMMFEFAPAESLPAESLNDRRYAAAALFAIEYALADLLSHWGMEPDYAIGHDTGAIAAACVAGALDLEVAMTLIRGTADVPARVMPPTVALVCSATGDVLKGELTAGYWTAHERPVNFQRGIRAILDAGCTILVELGPGAECSSATAPAFDASRSVVVPMLAPEREDVQIRWTLARAYTVGAPVKLDRLFADAGCVRTSLPLYPFQRERHWFYRKPDFGEDATSCKPSTFV